jgi:hypothetical protein
MNWTFYPDPNLGGTYYRKIEDIQRGLSELGADQLSEPARFVALYFGCEKLAKMIVGIHLCRNANDATEGNLKIDELRAAVKALDISVMRSDIDDLFVPDRGDISIVSGRALRNRLTHEFGPTNVIRARDHSPKLTPLARSFLAKSSEVLAILRGLQPKTP